MLSNPLDAAFRTEKHSIKRGKTVVLFSPTHRDQKFQRNSYSTTNRFSDTSNKAFTQDTIKDFAEENKNLTFALEKMKELFIDSLVEKDQEIAILNFELSEVLIKLEQAEKKLAETQKSLETAKKMLEEAQKNNFEEEHCLDEMKAQIRSQAIELEENESLHRRNIDEVRKGVEEEWMGKFIQEIVKNEEKEKEFYNQYREMEDRLRKFEGRVLEKEQEIEEMIKENMRLFQEKSEIMEKSRRIEKKIDEAEMTIKSLRVEKLAQEEEMQKEIEMKKEKLGQMGKYLIEAEKKITFFETKAKLYVFKYQKKKQKLQKEITKSLEIHSSYQEELKKLATTFDLKEQQMKEEVANLSSEIHNLKEEKFIQKNRLMKKQNSLKSELNFDTFEEKDSKALFERIGGNFISKNKFIEIGEVLEGIVLENDNFADDLEPYLVELKRILKGLEGEMDKLKKENREIREEKDILLKELKETMQKLEENERKKRENGSFFNGFRLIPFFKG